MDGVFTTAQMEVCNLPLPTGYPLSWTHSGICYVPDGFNGYKYLITSSPFPEGQDQWENPMFHYANERTGGLPPINFTAYANNPLQEDPVTTGTAYNADPDILIFNGELYVTNRPYDTQFPTTPGGSTKSQRTWVNTQKAVITNGAFSFTSPVDLYDNRSNGYFGYSSGEPTLVSPAIIVRNGKVRSYHLITNSYNNGSKCKKLVIMEGNDLVTPNSMTFLKFGSILGKQIEPWHIDVFEYGTKLYAVICGIDKTIVGTNQARQYLAVSDDWENFRLYQRPLVSYTSYRGSACVRPDGMFILYNTSVAKYLPGQTSVDGRDIILSYMPFVDLLKALN